MRLMLEGRLLQVSKFGIWCGLWTLSLFPFYVANRSSSYSLRYVSVSPFPSSSNVHPMALFAFAHHVCRRVAYG